MKVLICTFLIDIKQISLNYIQPAHDAAQHFQSSQLVHVDFRARQKADNFAQLQVCEVVYCNEVLSSSLCASFTK